MERAKKIRLILMLACFITIAGTVYADCPSAEELKVRKPTQGEISSMVRCATTNVKFQVASDTPVIDYKGKSYFFCCEPCMEAFKKDPDKYAAAKWPIEELKVRQPTQGEIGSMVRCATMNVKFQVESDTPVIDYKGKSYFFCCKPCMETFMKDPDAYAK